MTQTIILVTTRDYYSLDVPKSDLIEIDKENLKRVSNTITNQISIVDDDERKSNAGITVSDLEPVNDDEGFENDSEAESSATTTYSPSDEPDYIENLKSVFIKGGSSEDRRCYNRYWDDWNGKLYLKRIIATPNNNHQYVIYVAPCFPTDYYSGNFYIRHTYIDNIFGQLLNPNAYLFAHDKDLYIDSDERSLTLDDFHQGGDILSAERIPPEKVFGFQHLDEANHVYSVFIKKLNKLTFNDCDKAIKTIASDKENRNYYSLIDQYPFKEDGSFNDDGTKEAIDVLIDKIKI